MCSNAAPSPVTFSIYFNHVHVLVRKYNCMENMGGLLKEKILYCFDITIQHSYKLIGSEENLMMIVACLQSFILSHWSVYHYQRLNCTYYHNMAVCISVAVVSTMVRQVMWSAKRAVNSFQLLLCPMTPFMGVSLCTACKYHY